MGYWYWRPLKSSWAFDENTTNKFDLPERGHLSALYLKLRLNNLTSNYALDNCWPFQQTTLRVVGNGNVEIIDLRGRQLEAINWWNSGEMPKNVLWDDISGTAEAYAMINFGRYLGDPKYGMILDKFAAGVEFEDSNTVSTTYFTDGSNYYDIWGLFRKNPEAGLFAGGYLKKRQIINKDTASETQYGVKLPTTNLLRNIHMFTEPDLSSNLPATTPFTNLQYIWLGVKSKEEYIIDNASASIFARAIHQMFGRKAHTAAISKVASAADNYIDTMIYERENTHLTTPYTAGAFASENAATFWERICQAYGWTATATRVSCYVYMDAWGICYHGLIPLLAVDPKADQDQWLDSDAMKDVYVEFTEGASTGNIYIVLDELQKSYPS